MGSALAAQLASVPEVRRVIVCGRRPVASWVVDPFRFPAIRYVDLAADVPSEAPTLIVLAVADGAIAHVAHGLARRSLPPVPVLHTSGAFGREVLTPLADLGHPAGSVHPLVSVPRGAEDGYRFGGAWFGVEGDVIALEAATALVAAVGGRALIIDAGAKPKYHAASVIASNFLVGLLDVAARLMTESGVDEGKARLSTTALATGAVENVARWGPVDALTGPISRGDLETVKLHLAGLSAHERTLYSVVASEVLSLARRQGLDSAVADQFAEILDSP
jgi:predicted short-subunit dehydrogenase-like oxidoreductase (DUF2520 family)